ncbi:MAG TPA: hypothetical protein VIM42_09280 [Clostridium sp.]
MSKDFKISNKTIAIIISILFISVWIIGWVIDPNTGFDRISHMFNVTSPMDMDFPIKGR